MPRGRVQAAAAAVAFLALAHADSSCGTDSRSCGYDDDAGFVQLRRAGGKNQGSSNATECICPPSSGNPGSCCSSKDSGGKDTGDFCGSAFQEHHCGGETPICCTSSNAAQCCKKGSVCSPNCKNSLSCDCIEPATAACPTLLSFSAGLACECTCETCGTLPMLDPKELDAGKAMIITSTAPTSPKDTPRFMDFKYDRLASGGGSKMAIQLNPDVTLQEILGFGGAFTDATAWHYDKLSTCMKNKFVEQHFGSTGLGYTVGRVPMGASDFSRMNYVLDNVTDDYGLEHFCLRDDTATDAPCGSDYKISVIKAAQDEIRKASSEDKLKLYVSSWSAPLWYKDQKWSCTVPDTAAIPVCTYNESLPPAVTCSHVIDVPCSDNLKAESCPATPLNQSSIAKFQEGPRSPPASLLGDPRSGEASFGTGGSVSPGRQKKTGDRQPFARKSALTAVATTLLERARAEGRSSEFTRKLERTLDAKNPTPEDPMNNCGGNCYNCGFLRQDDKAQQSWALMFSKFIEAYEAQGVDVWGLTIHNEPYATMSEWQAMYYRPEGLASFLAGHLGPLMRSKHPGLKLMFHDDQTSVLKANVMPFLENDTVAQYIDGVAYHWYLTLGGVFENNAPSRVIDMRHAELGGGADVKTVWEKLQEQSKDKFMLMSEACNGFDITSDKWFGPRPGEWGYGYDYSHDILWQLRNGAAGWTDWNLMLDERGGPNLQGNFVDSPVVFKDADTIYMNPSFFHMAHFSRYVVPGSKQVDMKITCGAKKEEYCQAVAFLTPQGHAVVVITNDEVKAGQLAEVEFLVPDLAKGEGKPLTWEITCKSSTVSGEIPWKAIQTVIMPCQ